MHWGYAAVQCLSIAQDCIVLTSDEPESAMSSVSWCLSSFRGIDLPVLWKPAFLHFLVFFVLKRASHIVKAIQKAVWTWFKGCWFGDISKVDVVHREAFWIEPKWNTCRYPELWQRHEELCAGTHCASWLCREGTLSPSASVWGSAHVDAASSC